MEQLDGKYFEKTILALKQVKAGENYVINPQFRTKLRDSLLEKITLMESSPAQPGWVDAVLRLKYVFAGVPVLAALLLVVSNFSSWSVKIPSQEIQPVVNQRTTSFDAVGYGENSITQLQTTQNNGIVTFSAESVMPPADALLRAKSKSVESSQIEAPPRSDVVISQKVVLTNLKSKEEIEKNPIPVPDYYQGVVEDQSSKVLSGIDSSVTNLLDPSLMVERKGVLEAEQPLLPLESLNTGVAIVPSPSVEMNNSVLPAISQNTLPNPVSNASDSLSGVNTNADSSQPIIPPTLSLDLITAVLPVKPFVPNAILKVDPKNTYLDPAVEKIQLPVESKFAPSILSAVSPVYLEASKIVFQGERRPEVVAAVIKGLADNNGKLSADYSIVVSALPEEKFKAVLFENGKVKEVLILSMVDGVLKVITQISY